MFYVYVSSFKHEAMGDCWLKQHGTTAALENAKGYISWFTADLQARLAGAEKYTILNTSLVKES